MIIFVSDAFVEQYQGGGELTTEAIIEASYFPVNKVLSTQVSVELMEKHKDAYWVFGNFAGLKKKCMLHALKNLDYSVIEFDYKFCKFRSVKKHIEKEGKCECEQTLDSKLVATFLAKSKTNFWMSHSQLKKYQKLFPFLANKKNIVLSSVFSDNTLKYLNNLDINKKNNKWIILNSPSWIKGKDLAVKHAEENNLDYELVWGLSYPELLSKLAAAKGLIFLPLGADTCPRLVIEAKILGCEITTNEDVQHAKEPWFKNRDTILAYLKTRARFFWEKIEKLAAKNLNFSPKRTKKEVNFKIVVPFYNAENWIDKCINSLKVQNNTNFKCYLVDDQSTDSTFEIVSSLVSDDPRFELKKSDKKTYALGNISKTISRIKCDDEDVIILLDGDDWLASSYTLDTLAEAYDKKCLMTYGSYVYNPSGIRGVEPSDYPEDVVKNNTYREDDWRASHLRSFKFKLWKKLDDNDLKDEKGEYFKMAYDQAVMLPLLELAGPRAKYVKESLYVYNKQNPLNVDKIKAEEQLQTAQAIRKKKKYKRLA
tara:strand:+ start:6777 stop:8393 length:1617 start_codon:yes stop_codon:yes gene_type:complete